MANRGNVAIWYWKRALVGCSVVLGVCVAGCGEEPQPEPGQAVVSPLDTAPDAGAPASDAGTENGASHLGGGSGAGKAHLSLAVPPRRD
jgi:hypothetical protein